MFSGSAQFLLLLKLVLAHDEFRPIQHDKISYFVHYFLSTVVILYILHGGASVVWNPQGLCRPCGPSSGLSTSSVDVSITRTCALSLSASPSVDQS